MVIDQVLCVRLSREYDVRICTALLLGTMRIKIELKTVDGMFKDFPINVVSLRKDDSYLVGGLPRPVILLKGRSNVHVLKQFNSSEARDACFEAIHQGIGTIECHMLFGDSPKASISILERYGSFYVKRAIRMLPEKEGPCDLFKVYPSLVEGILPFTTTELEWFYKDAARVLPYPKDVREHGISPFTFYKWILKV